MSVIKLAKLSKFLKSFWNAHKYQKRAFYFLLANRYGALFLDPGLGKTSIVLRTIRALINSKESKGILIIAPVRVCYLVWPAEILKWVNFRGITFTILHGSKKDDNLRLKRHVYIINPEGLPWLYEKLHKIVLRKGKIPFDTLFVDESTKFKVLTAKTRFQLLKDLLPLFIRRYIMTGTPVPKSLLDLWSQVYILDQGKALGNNFYHFRKRYFYTEDWNKHNWILKEGSKEKIEELVHHLILEMSADDYLDLPEFIENDIEVQLKPKARKLYNKFEKELFLEFGKSTVSADQLAQKSMKCHQIANGNVYEDIPEDLIDDDEIKQFKKTRKTIHIHKAKIEALLDLIDELNGKPLLIAYNFKHDLAALKAALGNDVPVIGSGATISKGKRLERQWNAGELSILLAQPASIAHGLNMQDGGSDICFFSMIWSLENYIQFVKRLHRQGAKGDNVRVHRIIALDTVDEIMRMRLRKMDKEQKSFREAIKLYRNKRR